MNFLIGPHLNRIMLPFLFLLLQLVSISAFSKQQNPVLTQNRAESLNNEGSVYYEKIYIHLDRSTYSIGEDIWFKAYLLDAESNLPITKSKMVHVELINSSNKIVDSRVIKIVEGGGDGEFQIPANSKVGAFTVRAYTDYMRNFDETSFFRKIIQVKSGISQIYQEASQPKDSISLQGEDNLIESKPDIQFFPEGGYMVADLSSRIGFKALNSEGKSISISGYIEDDNGKKIVEFSTLNLGLGSFRMNPEMDKTYKAVVQYKEEIYEYSLVESLEKGISMQVVDRGDHYQINIQSTLPNGVYQLSFIGKQRGIAVSQAKLETNSKNGLIKVPKSSLEEGIVKFTLYDKNYKPLSERLVYAETELSKPALNIQINQDKYYKRDQVEIDFYLDVSKNQLQQANMSIAITDLAMVPLNDCDLDIQSYLMLRSELKGEIEDPCYYFNSKEPERKRVLDLLMMTQGWRKYLWNETVGLDEQKWKYAFETGINFKGTVKSIYNHKVPVNSDISLTYKNRDLLGHVSAKTIDQGRFLFQGYQFNDSTSIIIQAEKDVVKKGKKSRKSTLKNRDFYIELDSFMPPKITIKPGYSKPFDDVGDSGPEARKRARYLDSLYANQLDFVNLGEIELTAISKKRENDKYLRKDMRYVQPTARVDYEKLHVTALGNDLFWTLVNNVPGLSMVGDQLVYRGGSSSLSGDRGAGMAYLLNGIPVTDINYLVNADEVSFIDILTGPSAVMYSAITVIAVYTKRASDQSINFVNRSQKKGIMSFIHPGFYKARKFYEPNYKSTNSEEKIPDFRTTLFWKPTLKLDKNGKARISFYAADASTTYKVEIEGVTLDGYPIKNKAFFDVE